MYRTFAVLLLASVTAAPQDAAITYVKLQTQTDEPITAETYSATPIENILPTTIQKQIEDILASNEDGSLREMSTTEILTEPTEAVTEGHEVRTTLRAKPKFYSKLSYFEKPDHSSVLTNLVEKPGRRRFRSRCRCEKISNCPKLQISVPRCPNEQFMCCF